MTTQELAHKNSDEWLLAMADAEEGYDIVAGIPDERYNRAGDLEIILER